MADFAVKRRTITQSRPIFRRILFGTTSGPLRPTIMSLTTSPSKSNIDRRLQLSSADMRAMGDRTLGMILEHFENLYRRPVTNCKPRRQLEALLREPLPEYPASIEAVFEQLRRDIFGNIMHQDHPRCFSFIPGPNNFVSVMADALAAAFNVIACDWLEASGPTEIELVTIDWLRQLCGLPESAGGLFVSGGSVANLTALGAARHLKLRDQVANAVLYCSDQAHSSIFRALQILGFEPGQARKLPSDHDFRLPVTSLREAVRLDRDAGRLPFCVVANAGTTNTGAVDPLRELAELCRTENLWFHVDGAYGAAAVLCDEGRRVLDGLGQVDSLSLNPHKWLFQPYDIGCLLVRDATWLKETYCVRPEYLADVDSNDDAYHFCDHGIQLTRSFRALKLWASMKIFGLQAFREAITYGIRLAEFAESVFRNSDSWTVTTPAQLGIVTFRFRCEGKPNTFEDSANQQIASRMVDDGYASLSTTRLHGRTVLRMCTINPRTTEADIRSTVGKMEAFGDEALQANAPWR
jgi:aromatic-L-amino-acid decarboxylase